MGIVRGVKVIWGEGQVRGSRALRTRRWHGTWIAVAAVAAGSAALAGPGIVPPTEEASAPTPRHVVAPIWLDNRSRPAGLDVVQRDGGRDVDYIIEALGSGAAWLDYEPAR